MSEEHLCMYCNRTFSCKTALNKHKFGSCLWLHTSRREKLDEIDAFEPSMTDKQRDTMIRHLLLQMTKMNEKIGTMQKEITYLKQKQKISILNHLNSLDTVPKDTLAKWAKNLPISQRHLELVFQKTLKEGILAVLQDELESAKILQRTVPLRAYIQKPKTVYVYERNPEDESTMKWMTMDTPILKKICSGLGARFFEMYLRWQNENIDYLQSSSDAQEQDIVFMQKVMDESHKTNVCLGKMIEQLHAHNQINFQTIDYDE